VAYYQQVGRAGRALDRAYGILLNGREDDEIQDYFIGSAFPPTHTMSEILETLEKSDKLSFNDILSQVNVSPAMTEKALSNCSKITSHFYNPITVTQSEA
jgi:ATP-dependent DNA helicase RecQ